jgi:histidine triad (HIT) family protein
MYNNTPANYVCPICLGLEGVVNEDTMLRPDDLIYKNDLISVFMNSFFIKGNEGHVIVVPNKHIENIYDLDSKSGSAILKAAKKMAIAIKKACLRDGITLRQNNEPAGDQHAFHFHLHVFPRYKDDLFNTEIASNKIETTLDDRRSYIEKLKAAVALTE